MAVVKAGGHGPASLRGYIISPVANPVSLIREYASTYANELAKDLGVTVEICYWDKNEGTYLADWLEKANFVVFLPTNNKFEAEIETKPMINEFERASKLCIPIYLGYRSSEGIKAYDTHLFYSNYRYSIRGISGTSDNLLSQCRSHIYHFRVKIVQPKVSFSHHVVESTKTASPSAEKTFKVGDWSYDERLLLLLL
jgi:hypothetical protein